MDIRAIKHGNRPRTDRNRLLELAERVSGMKEVETLLYLDYREPDARFLEKAVASGVSGLKIWNGTFILNGAEKDCYDGRAWREVFDFIEQRGLPVLWHVTQRLSDAPYVGGGRNSYWKQGWKRGAVYTNQDLLDSFLRIVGSHPGIPFLGAHQLHVGWEKLDELFCEYANLHVDTSIGCFLRPDDEIHPEDAERIRKVIGKWPDRFLFGTDTGLGPIDEEDPPLTDLKGHLRFLRHLGLSDSILQLVTHGNGERIFRRITGQEKESQG
jgi:predicted TIM-barrel fold metal-dependent hydrolase